jgi:hypothetical protein
MVEKTEQNLKLVKTNSTRDEKIEVVDKHQPTHQTNPIARKLLDFSLSNKTRKFSVKDLFTR